MITKEELENKRTNSKELLGLLSSSDFSDLAFIGGLLSRIILELEYMNDLFDTDREKLAIKFNLDYKDSKAGFETKVGGTD